MTIMTQGADDLDHLYTRYSCRLLAGITGLLAEIGPAAVDLDEDVAQDVWAHVAEHGLPVGRTGLDGLLAVADRIVARVRTAEHRRREVPAGLTRTAPAAPTAATRRVCPTNPRLPRTVSAASAALHTLPLAG